MSNRRFGDRFRRQKGGAAMNVAGKLEGNVNRRIDAGRALVNTQIGIVKGFFNKELTILKGGFNKVMDLEPVPAVIDTALDSIENVVDVPLETLDNIGSFIKTQASITKDWVPER